MIAALFEDDEILVLDKPAGLPSQPGEAVRVSVVEAVERDFGFRPFLVHRLDKDTAGCLVVARSAAAAAKWSRLVESRELRKTYRALVYGSPSELSGRFSDPVPTKGGDKTASTAWRLVGSFGCPAGGENLTLAGSTSFRDTGTGDKRSNSGEPTSKGRRGSHQLPSPWPMCGSSRSPREPSS